FRRTRFRRTRLKRTWFKRTWFGRTRNELAFFIPIPIAILIVIIPAESGAGVGRAHSQRVPRSDSDRALRLGAAAGFAKAEFGNAICGLVPGIAGGCGASGARRFRRKARRTAVGRDFAGRDFVRREFIGKHAACNHHPRSLGTFRLSDVGGWSVRGDGTSGSGALAPASAAPKLYGNRRGRS